MKNEHQFSEEEWITCLKVLEALKDNPLNNPDNKRFSGLITKISKNAKKINRNALNAIKKKEDLDITLESVIANLATAGNTMFSSEDKKQASVYKTLHFPKNCYCCNSPFQLAHFFYNRLCETCAEENYNHRFLKTDLSGRTVILTGGRVKIGFATALKVLRSGANLVLTTRFPALAFEQFEKEHDFKDWENRLLVYGLDLRNINAIYEFIAFYRSKYGSLDILINNAAQTIKYEETYYLPIITKENRLMTAYKEADRLFANKTPVLNTINQLEYDSDQTTAIPVNRFGQPIDTRDKNSWNTTLAEVPLHELIEVHLINQIAPYILIKELKDCFEKSMHQDKFIINVTSSEGNFNYTNKTKFHPHTNMTKAALNMMTLTSAKEFAERNIYMCAVDVGWVSTGAIEKLKEQQFLKGYIPPLDSVDGACRIFHPIIEGLKGNHIFGVLLKNYKISDW